MSQRPFVKKKACVSGSPAMDHVQKNRENPGVVTMLLTYYLYYTLVTLD